MSVYSISGAELDAIYDVYGDDIDDGYDIDGENVYTKIPLVFDIDDVVSYYRADVLTTASAISDLSDQWTSFIFVTDTHTGNSYNSQAIVMYLLANTPVKMAFFGGDYVGGSWNQEHYRQYFFPFIENGFASRVYPTIGNHELFLYGGSTWDDLGIIYDDFLTAKSNLHGNPQDFYYYFDDSRKKIRYMVINTSDHSGNKVTQEQFNWLYSAVTLPTNAWNLVVLGHIDIDVLNFTGQWMSAYAQALTNAISSCNGHIVGYFCGHEHIDQLRLVNNRFYQLISLCDVFENDNYFDVDNYPTRVRGTSSEQAVTVVSFNTTTGDVVTHRIGAGDEYAWNYKTLQTAV